MLMIILPIPNLISIFERVFGLKIRSWGLFFHLSFHGKQTVGRLPEQMTIFRAVRANDSQKNQNKAVTRDQIYLSNVISEHLQLTRETEV